MNYSALSLNGTWEMSYTEEKYIGHINPWENPNLKLDGRTGMVQDAVPGYWEDMTESFLPAPFYSFLRINPAYVVQQYPMSSAAPDMVLPNFLGNFFYRRTFVCGNISEPSALHFDGVHNAVSVWINDKYLGRHEGYSTPFDIEIPEGLLVHGENTVVLSVSNHRLEGFDGEPVSGLTSRAANECTGGVTGNVELRIYNCPLRDVAVVVSDNCDTVTAKVEMTEKTAFEWEVCEGNAIIKKGNADGDFTFDTDGMEMWSPENPKLYTLRLICADNSMSLKFGVRRLVAHGPHFKLSGYPYYLRGICEHCYFPETIHPAHDLDYYRSIVKKIKELGFNFIRFHTCIPEEEYMQAADELGVLLHVESPNNTSLEEWKQIVKFCRKHTSVVIYCCGNELQMHDTFIEHIKKCADEVHKNTDSLFSPMSALRGLEYCHTEEDQKKNIVSQPFEHNPKRIDYVSTFSDMFSSYARGAHSYHSLDCDAFEVDGRSYIYNHKPRVSHEICIDGTYTDLSLKDRYKGTRVGKTDMFDSIERHLESKGLLKNAPLYFKNSSEWQRRNRKYCFESVRRSEYIAGYDFLGPIDTHWHTFGYDVGMMNEFYELKPGETVRNVLMYNSETVLLNDLARKTNFVSEEKLQCGIYLSCYNKNILKNAKLVIRILTDGNVFWENNVLIESIENGRVSKIYDLSVSMPVAEKPSAVKLCVTLESNEVYAENEWELYLFPTAKTVDEGDLLVASSMSGDEIKNALKDGKTVVLTGSAPFNAKPTSFRIALAGRTSGNLATVIAEHPLVNDIPHDCFCGWQFAEMMEGGSAVCFECENVPFRPIIEVVSTHKYAVRQAALFEFAALEGKLIVCGFDFKDTDPAARWFKSELISYANSEKFNPEEYIDETQLDALINSEVIEIAGNNNFAVNPNDKTSKRKKK